MINQLLIEELILSPLCIESKYLQAMVMSAFAAYSQGKPLANSRYEAAYAIKPDSGIKQSKDFAPGSVGMVIIDGPIVSASDPWNGIKGTLEAAQELQLLDADPNILGTVLYVESGGGAVYALKPIVDVLNSLNKPVVTFSKQILASAGYRIGANTDHIMMYHPQGIVGSIGTMMSSSDMQPMFEKWGMKFFEYYATESTLKNKTFTDAKNGDPKALIKNMLDPMNELFISDIKDLRGDKIDAKEKSIYQGETFMASPQGIDNGLIDSIGSLQDAVALVVQLANGTVTSSQSQSLKKSNNMFGNKFKSLSALKSKQAAAVTAADVQAINAEIEAEGIPGVTAVLDSELEATLTENVRLKAEAAGATTAVADLATANAKITALEAAATTAKTAYDGALATLTTDRDSWKAKAIEFGAKPADAPTGGAVVVEEEIKGSENTQNAFYTEADAEMKALRAKMGIKPNVPSAKKTTK